MTLTELFFLVQFPQMTICAHCARSLLLRQWITLLKTRPRLRLLNCFMWLALV